MRNAAPDYSLLVLHARGVPHTTHGNQPLALLVALKIEISLEIPMRATSTTALAPAAKATETAVPVATTFVARILKAIDKACAAGAEGSRGL
jgi:hypothetical protein